MVVIGNPPYNAWQKNENDNNKNRKYPVIDEQYQRNLCKRVEGNLTKCTL